MEVLLEAVAPPKLLEWFLQERLLNHWIVSLRVDSVEYFVV